MRAWLALFLVFSGCDLPGKPGAESLEGQPQKVVDFNPLYRANCSACHGEAGRGGAALSLANPIYFAIADEATVHHIIANGVPKTAMPAFASSAGGMLTETQVDVLARGLRTHWGNGETLSGPTPPSYSGPKGQSQRGASVYATFCARCHGAEATGGDKAGSIIDGAFLSLVSAQGLRTTLIAGRPDLGHPDWRMDLPDRALTSQQIADVVAWLESHRPPLPH